MRIASAASACMEMKKVEMKMDKKIMTRMDIGEIVPFMNKANIELIPAIKKWEATR